MPRIEHRRHKHDVVADTLCRVYILDGEGLARLNRGHPEIVRHIREVAHARERENEWGSLLAAAGPRTEFSRQGYGRDRSALSNPQAATRSAMVCCKRSSILSINPVVESQA